MSSIIVRGMDKPESCGKCFFRDGIFCKAKNYKRISYVALDGKIEIWCPLIEIPTPHGRLIDADALISDLVKYQNTLDPESRENARVLSVKSYLTLARGEAIIEAEEGE